MEKTRKVAYIIPAYSEDAGAKRYRIIFEYFKGKGVTAFPIRISWKGNTKTPSDYRKEFQRQYNRLRRRGDEVYLFGYSMGAQIALMSAAQIKPRSIILCSIAPWFSETIPNLPKRWMKWHSRWIPDYKRYRFETIAKGINADVLIFVGTSEHKIYTDQAKLAKKLIKNCKVVAVPKAKHALGQKEYQAALKKNLVK